MRSWGLQIYRTLKLLTKYEISPDQLIAAKRFISNPHSYRSSTIDLAKVHSIAKLSTSIISLCERRGLIIRNFEDMYALTESGQEIIYCMWLATKRVRVNRKDIEIEPRIVDGKLTSVVVVKGPRAADYNSLYNRYAKLLDQTIRGERVEILLEEMLSKEGREKERRKREQRKIEDYF